MYMIKMNMEENMLVKVKKVLLDEQKVCTNVPMNTQIHKIVAELFEINYSKYFSKIDMQISLDDVLFISDSITRKFIDIPSSYFEEFTELSEKFQSVSDQILSIPTVNAYIFESMEYVEKVFENSNRPSLIILGFINNIPKHIMDNILNVFGRTKIYMFGDEIITSPELGDHFNNMLTNSEYVLSLSYSDYKNSIQKKLNSTLHKLRDKRTQNMSVIPTGQTTIRKRIEDEIVMDNIQDALEAGSNIVVPRRLVTSINSRIRNMFGSSSTISLDAGEIFYTRFPFVTLVNDNPIVIPPGSKVSVQISNDAETFNEGRRIMLRNVSVKLPGSKYKIDLVNVPIDFTGYLMQFDENEHIGNYEDFNELTEYDDPLYFNPSTMSIMPHLIYTSIEQKYIEACSLVVYLENLDLDPIYRNRALWFQEMFGATDELEIIISSRFNEL